MTLTIEQLRELVKLNMDEKCFSIYRELVEPNIKAMLRDYLRGWQDLENIVNRLTFRSKGAYKTDFDVVFSKDDDVSKYEDKVELKIYYDVSRLDLYQKIDYLHEVGILKKSTTDLLHFLRIRRNKIHENEPAFSEIERSAFSFAYNIVGWIHTVNLPNFPNIEQKQRILNDCEIEAENLLKRLKDALDNNANPES